MKIAIASEGEQVAGHFGHCSNFNVYELDQGKILERQTIENPGHKPGFLPNFLNDLGVKLVVAGGMGQGAIDIFEEKNIGVVTGAAGDCDEVIQAYLAGQLESSGSVCQKHEHSHECGGH